MLIVRKNNIWPEEQEQEEGQEQEQERSLSVTICGFRPKPGSRPSLLAVSQKDTKIMRR